jgi:porin
MPADIITNAVASTVGSLALLLNPTEHKSEAETSTNEASAEASETLLGNWGGKRDAWSDHGYDFTIQYIGEGMANTSGGNKRGIVYNGLLNVAADVNLDKAAGWKGATFHTGLLLPHGRSITDNYVGDSYVASNLDADGELHLFELWLEQSFAEDKFSVRLGQMAVDQEFAFTEQGALFNSSAFGWFPIFGATAPVYPQGAPGVRLKWNTCEQSYLQFAVVDGDIDPNADNTHGVKTKFNEGALILGEAGYNWDNNGKAGSVKLGAWYHTAHTDHVRTDDTGLSLADPLTSGTPESIKGNWGLYAAAEQVLWKESDDKDSEQGLGVFGRVGYEPSDRNFLGFYAEGGVTRTGLLPGRDDDVSGIGIAYGRVSSDTRGFVEDDKFFNATGSAVPDHEMVIEAEYQINVRPGLVVQPGVQFIVHPGGSSATKDATIIGLRTIIDF